MYLNLKHPSFSFADFDKIVYPERLTYRPRDFWLCPHATVVTKTTSEKMCLARALCKHTS